MSQPTEATTAPAPEVKAAPAPKNKARASTRTKAPARRKPSAAPKAEAAPADTVYEIEGRNGSVYRTTSATEAVNARARGRVVTEK